MYVNVNCQKNNLLYAKFVHVNIRIVKKIETIRDIKKIHIFK